MPIQLGCTISVKNCHMCIVFTAELIKFLCSIATCASRSMLWIVSAPPMLVFLICRALKLCPGELVEFVCLACLDQRVLSVQLAWVWVHSNVWSSLFENGLYVHLWEGLPESKRKLYDNSVFSLFDIRVLNVTLADDII